MKALSIKQINKTMIKFLKKYLEIKEKELEIREKEMAVDLLSSLLGKTSLSNLDLYFEKCLSVVRHGSLTEALTEISKEKKSKI